ncbi:Sir2 family NAD-dependent protein deacetylase [Aeromicrobium duanguangcaii]|uniref:protein acetyllysine N-acetyltransferase n=1 Tax=Aeromicrobium duanguangcaii TaxID=2968086 RepID=A0ABY5KEJ7_9ACTN|nr:Sir2 family NAD-dependent protein deacetylase [Aeromicrobium duanguangcaii]MCD9154486.1 NAD-dependent deacetylase [Aeromicrobium duanguangcaii]MCL3838234.1 NAD-dependent deacetylase [Aeromicrobium duanguangcaii]UUI68458.1 NAD-dependent deacetylase [Aeromicrobium duanguangcaii]
MSDWYDRPWLVLTGAGVSTDSGIPDYRGPDAVPRQPMTYQDFIASAENRRRYWARAHIGWARMGGAEPNFIHHFLAQHQDRLVGLITQNVDGLHEKAGSREVVDLHGRLDRVACLDCGDVTARDELQARLDALNPGWADQEVRIAPDGDVDLEDTSEFVVAECTQCGGRLKPDVVFFGESVPKRKVAHCFDLVERAGREGAALVVMGSSLQVMSGLRFVRRAAKDGTEVVIINRGPTRGDALADVRIDDGVAETLRRLSGA